MVTQDVFIIDATFVLDDAERAFLGSAPLVDGGGRSTSVVYGAVRALLHLRQTLGIAQGTVVVGADANEVASALNIHMFRDFLAAIGTNVLHKPEVRVGALCRAMLLGANAAWIVTRNKSLMQLVNARCSIILAPEGAAPDVTTESTFVSRHHFHPEQVPSFLALTDSRIARSLTNKQAIRLLEVYGTLNAAFDNVTAHAISPKARRYLIANKTMLLARLREYTVPNHIGARGRAPIGPIIRNDKRSIRAFKDYGFPSLARLLKSPGKIELVGTERDTDYTYTAVVDRAGLDKL